MGSDQKKIKGFFLYSAAYTLAILIWLLATPSLSAKLVVGSYSLQRLLLVCLPTLFLVLEFIGFILSTRQTFQHAFFHIVSSKTVFRVSFWLDLFLFCFLCSFAINIREMRTLLLERISPILLLAFLGLLQVCLYQLLLSHRQIWKAVWPPLTSTAEDYIADGKRDLRLDFLRGFFVLVMLIDHIGGNSPLYYLTFGDRFFVSAAEGFFLISGIVAGIVYSRVMQRQGLKSGIIKALNRLLTLYLITICLSILVLFVEIHFLGQPAGSSGSPFSVLLKLLLFINQYDLANVLVVYTLLFLFYPLALILLKSNKSWVVLVLSIGTYTIFRLFPQQPWGPFDTFMDFSGVQLFFFGGVLLGYHRVLDKIDQKLNTSWLIIFGTLLVSLIVFWNMVQTPSFFSSFPLSQESINRIWHFFDKGAVAPGRLLASFITFGFLYILVTLRWKEVQRLFGWLVLPMGQNALFAYTVHVVIVMIFSAFAYVLSYDWNNYWLNALLQLGGIFLIWFMIKKKLFTPKPGNRKIYYALPGLLIISFLLFETFFA